MSKELFYTLIREDKTRASGKCTYRFYTDSTYQCDHWNSDRYFYWRLTKLGTLEWMSSDKNFAPNVWHDWQSPPDFGQILEFELAIYNAINKDSL